MSTLWKDEYLLGNIIIDAEHKHMLTLIELYQNNLEDETLRGRRVVDTLVSLLKDHVTSHFLHEQLLMELAEYYGYPGKEEHIKEHNKIRETILTLVASKTNENLLEATKIILEHTTKYDLELSNKLKLSIEGLKHHKDSE